MKIRDVFTEKSVDNKNTFTLNKKKEEGFVLHSWAIRNTVQILWKEKRIK